MPECPGATVVIVVQNLPVPPDGRVWRHATSLVRQGFDVKVISPKGKGFTKSFETIDGVKIYRHPDSEEAHGFSGYIREYAQSLFYEFRLLRSIVARGPVHLIHICNPPDILFLLALYCKLMTGAVIVFDHHDLSPEMYAAKFRGGSRLLVSCLKIAEACTFMSADLVITTNESMRNVALSRGRRSHADVFLVRSAPPANDADPAVKGMPVPGIRTRRRVGYVGVLGEQDGVDNLLRAVSLIVHEHRIQDVGLIVIGDGPARESLMALVTELGIEKYVEFLGWRQRIDFRNILSVCDVCASPDSKTAYSDACAMVKLFEYMSLSKPIAAFDLTESRRIAGDAAIYAPSGDIDRYARDILKILNDESMRQRMGQTGRERFLKSWAWEHQEEQLYRAYDSALLRSGVAPHWKTSGALSPVKSPFNEPRTDAERQNL